MSKRANPQKQRPIMALLDVLGRRWTLRLLWELRDGALTFRALRAATEDVSPSVLNERLAELRAHGLIDLTEDGYALTERAQTLSTLLIDLDVWARKNKFGDQDS
jgi:DNA-binding HxlR family transcriptional regulator